jgi:hypothetical protein
MQITEPVTMLTDYTLAAAGLIFAILTSRMIGPRTRVCVWFWCAAFVASAVAAASGGTYHGFAKHLDPGIHRALWNVVMYSMGAAGAFFTAGIHSAYIKREDQTLKWLVLGIVVTLIGGAVQQTGFGRGEPFNHNDRYHLIQIAGLYFWYRCGRTLRDRPGIRDLNPD